MYLGQINTGSDAIGYFQKGIDVMEKHLQNQVREDNRSRKIKVTELLTTIFNKRKF